VLKDVDDKGDRDLRGRHGLGQSTSLAAMIGHPTEQLRPHHHHRDPEYVHEHKNCIITQREVGMDWFNALKNTRQART
jgi:twitching motility protein PilU